MAPDTLGDTSTADGAAVAPGVSRIASDIHDLTRATRRGEPPGQDSGLTASLDAHRIHEVVFVPRLAGGGRGRKERFSILLASGDTTMAMRGACLSTGYPDIKPQYETIDEGQAAETSEIVNKTNNPVIKNKFILISKFQDISYLKSFM